MANIISFDEQFYLSTYPDVAAAVSRGQFANGRAHFDSFGRFENRDPNAFFDTSFYLGQYPDVANARVNPLDHFLQNGAKEGRLPNANADGVIDVDGNDIANDFNASAYLAANADVKAAVDAGKTTAYAHFITFGQFEGRSGAQLNDGTVLTGPFGNGATGGGSGNGTTITLTQNLDGPNAVAPAANTNGTSGNDTYLADNNTLTADAINGSGGTDTLRVISNGGGNYSPSLTSVERIESSALGGTAAFDLTNSTGVQTIAAISGTGFTTATGLSNIVTVENGAVTAGGVQLTYNASVVAGATDTQKVSFSNSTTSGLFVNGVETIEVTSTGTNTVGALQSGSLSAVKFSGAGSITVAGALTGASTVDASSATGAVSVALDTTKDVTVTGGTGNDSFNFAGGLTTADKVNGGNGTDTVRSTTSGDLSGAPAAAAFNALTSIEKVAFDGTGVTLNGSTFTNTGITNIEFNTNGNDVINNAGSARTYEFGVANSGTAEFALNSNATSLKLALLGTDPSSIVSNDGQDADVGGITITTAGVNSTTTPVTIALTSQGDLADGFFSTGTFAESQFNQTGLVTVASGSTVNVDGTGNLAIFGGTAGAITEGFDNNVTLNTSASTGNNILVGSSFDTGAIGTVSTGVNGANTPTAEGIDTFTLGAGRDVIVFRDGLASGIAQVATPAGGATAADAAFNGNVLVDTINNFTAGAGGDVLFRGTNLANTAPTTGDYTAILSGTQSAINALSGAGATLLAAADLAANDASTGWTAFSFQGETYALFDNAQANTGYENGVDTLVKLTGVTISALTDANFEA